MKFQPFSRARKRQTFFGVFLAVLSFSKNNSLTTYKFINIRTFLICSDLGSASDIDRCKDENNPIMKYESLFPFAASLRQRTSRLGFVFSFHIDGYASFLRRRRLEPLVNLRDAFRNTDRQNALKK